MKTLSPSWTTDWVTGAVAGGFVQKSSGFTGCTNEKFAVTVSLIDVVIAPRSSVCFENGQRIAGTRRVHQVGHARARAG